MHTQSYLWYVSPNPVHYLVEKHWKHYLERSEQDKHFSNTTTFYFTSRGIRKEKEISGIKSGRKNRKLFVDDMTVSLENP